jgi:hypothetical protein
MINHTNATRPHLNDVVRHIETGKIGTVIHECQPYCTVQRGRVGEPHHVQYLELIRKNLPRES